MNKNPSLPIGFTLIEVLLALAIIAISLTALLRATGQDIHYTHRLKNKSVRHWIAKQAVTQIQANLITITKGRIQTFKTTMFKQDWFWRVNIRKTSIAMISKIEISVSDKNSGPFKNTLTAYKLMV